MDIWGKHLNRNFNTIDSDSGARNQFALRLRDVILNEPISSCKTRPTRKGNLECESQTQAKTERVSSDSTLSNRLTEVSSIPMRTDPDPHVKSIDALQILGCMSDRGALDVLETLEWRPPALPRAFLNSCHQPSRHAASAFSLPSRSLSVPTSGSTGLLGSATASVSAPASAPSVPKPFPKPHWADDWLTLEELEPQSQTLANAPSSRSLACPSEPLSVATSSVEEVDENAKCEKAKHSQRRRCGERVSRSGKALNENFVRLQKKKRFYGLAANARRRHGALGRGGLAGFKRRRFWRLANRSGAGAPLLCDGDESESDASNEEDAQEGAKEGSNDCHDAEMEAAESTDADEEPDFTGDHNREEH